MAVAAASAAAVHQAVGDNIMSAFISEADKSQLTEQIRTVESNTAGEIVTVITDSSDDYRYIPLLWSALLSLAVPGLYFLMQSLGLFDNDSAVATAWQSGQRIDGSATQPWSEYQWIYIIQAAVFTLCAMLFQWQNLRMRFIPDAVKHHRAHLQARAQFLTQNVHWTDHRAGILIFVSVAEHYVEIIADRAVASKVDNEHWQRIVDQFIRDVRQGNVHKGFTDTISQCGDILITHFPANKPATDELPNHLIEL